MTAFLSKTRTLRTRSIVPCGAIVMALVLSTMTLADEPASIPEIVVTAQKREQTAQDVPVSVSVVTGEQMAARGLNDIYDVARQTPTLEVESTNGIGTINFRLRRVGNLGNIPAFEPEVGLFVDGAFRSRSFYGAGELVDLGRIEILNGPQSTLYGKNTTAGVISMYTQAPEAVPTAMVEATVGALEADRTSLLGNVKGGISGPIGGGWSGSFAAGYSGHGAMFTAGFPGGPDEMNESRYATRAQLAYKGGNGFDLRLILEQSGENDRSGAPAAITFVPGSPAANLHDTLVRFGVAEPCGSTDPRSYGNCLLGAVTNNLSATAATLLWNYHFDGGVTLSSVTSWDRYESRMNQPDVIQLGAPLTSYLDQQSGHSIQQELRLTSPGHQTIDWLAGVFYYHGNFLRGDPRTPTFVNEPLAAAPFWRQVFTQLIHVPLLLGTPGQESFVNSTLATDYLGMFGQVVWNLTDQFRVNAGIRWQREQKYATIDQFQSDATPTFITAVVNPTIAPTDLSRSANRPTWSLTPQLDLAKDVMLYGTVSRGFKSGGYNTGFGRLPANQREFGDETVDHHEIGIKSMLANRRIQLNAAVFDTIYNNYQDAAFIGAQFTVGNAQKATNRGAELGLNAVVSDSLSADVDVSYANFKYSTYTAGVCYPGRVPNGSVPGTCDLSGQHPIDAPLAKVSVGLDYHVPVSFGKAFARFDADWTSRYNTSFSADPRLTQDPYTWIKVRLGADLGRTQVTLWCDNVLNKHVANLDALLNLFSGDPSTQTFLQLPRSFGITVRTKF